MRRRFKQTLSLKDRLAVEAQRLRDEARTLPLGAKRDRLMRRARQLETAASIDQWLSSPGLQLPN